MRSIDIYRERERKSEKLFFPLEYSKSRSRALINGERFTSFLLLSVCLRAKSQNVSVVFVLSRSFVFFSERLLFWTTREAKKASERERKRAKERAHPKKERKTQKDTERRRKTRKRILGREDDIVSDDDDSDDEKISSSTPGKIS